MIVGGGAFDAPQVQLSEIGKTLDESIKTTNRISGVVVDKYVIMPNHLHLILIITKNENNNRFDRANEMIPHAVGTLKRFVNRKAEKNVFQRSYHDHVIRGERDYQKIWSYIDDNPRRWKDDCFYKD
jgi:REP element-mobilizing transposase RayT